MDHSPADDLNAAIDVDEMKHEAQKAPFKATRARTVLVLGVGLMLGALGFYGIQFMEKQQEVATQTNVAEQAVQETEALADAVIQACESPEDVAPEWLCTRADDAKQSVTVQGDPGPTGPPGIPGITGPPGPMGPPGDDGPPGEPGEVGPSGVRGTDGLDGASGANGTDGAKGEKGDKGDTGEKGATGDTGPTGPKGDKGDQGDPGPTCPAGYAVEIVWIPMSDSQAGIPIAQPAAVCTSTEGD